MSKFRASETVQADINAKIAEADALKQKAESAEGLTAEEQAKLEELVQQIEALQSEAKASDTAERFAAVKDAQSQPTRSAPKFTPNQYSPAANVTVSDGFQAFFNRSRLTPELAHKARSLGLDISGNSTRLPISWKRTSYKSRALMNTGNTGGGAELLWKSYSDNVTHFLLSESPILGTLRNESDDSRGEERTFFKIDDTALLADFDLANSGTEVAPNIAEKVITTAVKTIKTFAMNSGYFKVTRDELRLAYAGVNIANEVAGTAVRVLARLAEKQFVQATGNGSNGVEGIGQFSTAIADAADLSPESMEELYYAMPTVYLPGCVWVTNRKTKKLIRQAARNSQGDDLFGTLVQDSREFQTYMDHPIFESIYVPDNVVYFIQPDHYVLRWNEGATLEHLVEKFHPHEAWYVGAFIGGGWVGPTGTSGSAFKMTLDVS